MDNNSNNQTENAVEIFDTAQLPTLDDWMREFSETPDAAADANTDSTGAAQPAAAAADELNEARQTIWHLELENKELRESCERVTNHFDKYRWRTERERGEHYSYAVMSIVREFLPIVDNFGRALHTAQTSDGTPETHAQFVGGVELIQQQIEKFLIDMGVQPIESTGAAFDPQYHEAVALEPVADVPANTVTEEILRGYRLGDKLIRAAMVKVSTNDER